MRCAGPGLGPKLGAGGTARRPWGRSPPRAGPRSRWAPPDMPDPASALLVPVLRPRANVASPERPAGSGSGAPLGGSRGRRERTHGRLGWGLAHLRPGEPRQAAVTCGDPGRAGGGVTTVGGGASLSSCACISGASAPRPREGTIIPREGDEAGWVPRARGQRAPLPRVLRPPVQAEAGAPRPSLREPRAGGF